MPGPTPPGARTAGWKFQTGHGFRRGQPIYLQSAGHYALATIATGLDGLVGSVSSDKFELVTGGELDGLTLDVNQIYSLSTTAGVLSTGTAYPVLKGLAADTGVLNSANSGTAGSDVVLPFTVSVTPTANAVPQADGTGQIASGWIPSLPYEPSGRIETHNSDFRAHSQYLVRSPEGGGILDIAEGSLVFDVDSLTQVIDEAFI